MQVRAGEGVDGGRSVVSDRLFERFVWGTIVALCLSACAAFATRPHTSAADRSFNTMAAAAVAGVRERLEYADLKPDYIRANAVVGDDVNVTMLVRGYMATASQFRVTLAYGWHVTHVAPFNGPAPGPG